jgi:hypothetical protein
MSLLRMADDDESGVFENAWNRRFHDGTLIAQSSCVLNVLDRALGWKDQLSITKTCESDR